MTPLSDRALPARCLRRFVRGALARPKMRQRYRLQVGYRLTSARNPIVGSAARDTWKRGHKIGSGEAGKLLCKCHHSDSTLQIKIRNAENRACAYPHCGHNNNTMTHAQYAAAIIETALNNGLTIEEIIAKGPDAIAEAHLHCQLKATDAAAEEARQMLTA